MPATLTRIGSITVRLRQPTTAPTLAIFNVSTYGAVGDGVTDDAAAIQSAIDSVNVFGGGTLRFGAGLTYLVGQAQASPGDFSTAVISLILKSGVRIDLNGSTIKAKPRTDLADSGMFVAHFASNVSITNGTLKGDRRTRATPVADNVDVNYSLAKFIECDHVTLDRLRCIESVGSGASFTIYSIDLESTTATLGSPVLDVPVASDNTYRLSRLKVGELVDTELVDCFPAGTKVVSVKTTAPRSVTLSNPATATQTGLTITFSPAVSQQIVLKDSAFDDNRFNGLVLESGRGFTIERCRFTNTQGTSPQAGVDIEPYYGTSFLRDVVFRDCYTAGNVGGGLLVQNMTNALVEGNIFNDSVMFRLSKTGTFQDNIARGGLTLKDSDVAALRNLFSEGGVSVYNYAQAAYRDPLNVLVEDNTFTGLTGASAFTVFNASSEAPEYGALTFKRNAYAARGTSTMSSAVIQRDAGSAAFQTVDISDNTFTIGNPHDRADVFRLPAAALSSALARNIVSMTSSTLRTGTVVFNCTASPVTATDNVMTKTASASATGFSGTVTKSGNTLNGSPA